jgi:hypothetical protein
VKWRVSVNQRWIELDATLMGARLTSNSASLLVMRATVASPTEPGGILVAWQSASNRLYTLQAATNLMTGFNLNLRTNIPATPPENVHTDNVSGAGMKFYRMKLETGN